MSDTDTPRTEQLRRKITAMRAGKIPQDEALELAVILHLQLERELAQAHLLVSLTRTILAGTDAGSLPNDFPVDGMAAERMKDLLNSRHKLAQAVEEGRRQMLEEAVQVCRHEAEGWRKQNCDPWANAVGACAISIQAIPVEKEPT